MNTLLLSLLLAGMISTSGLGTSPDRDARSPDTTTVTVEVDGAKNDDGQVVVALFAGADGFPRDVTKATYTAAAPIQDGAASVQVKGVEVGRYAVMAFHDANGDDEVDTNWFGRPKEGVAATNWTGGRPAFEESAMEINTDATLALSLRYP
jgi:uncharacterized protein (DUF2141 family)